MVNIYTQHLTISRVERNLQPKEVQAIFNSNPDFVRDTEGSEDRSAHTIEEVSRWPLITGQARENQRFLALRLRESGQLIGIADLLTPHPRGDYAALGLLILHRAWQGKGLGREAAGVIENVLSSEGWMEVEVVVQRVRLRSRRFWERCGYRLKAGGTNENGLPCWILRKRLRLAN
jgi:RimJ/RimL family protein N-acetyltransferase